MVSELCAREDLFKSGRCYGVLTGSHDECLEMPEPTDPVRVSTDPACWEFAPGGCGGGEDGGGGAPQGQQIIGSPGFVGKVTKGLGIANRKLANADADCRQLFADIGLAVEDVAATMNATSFVDGTTSQAQIGMLVNQQYANAVGAATVAQLFANSPGLSGWSPPGGTAYLRPSDMSNGLFGLGTNWQLLVHETLHQMLGFQRDDNWIMTELQNKGYRINPNSPRKSRQISDVIKKKCN